MAGPGPARFYSSTAVQTSLAAGISNANLSCQVNSVAGFPASTPFVLSLDQNSLSEELILVGGVSGTTLNSLTRGFNGTTPQSHNNGAAVVHVMCAQDLTDPQVHIGAFDNVHGVAVGSNVVGQNDTQTLTNKTLTSPTINTPTITTPTISGTATTGPITATGLVTATDLSVLGITGAVQPTRFVGGSNQAPTTGTFAQGDYTVDGANGLVWVCITAGTPGTWESSVNKDSVQTLNNKTLASPTLSGTTTAAAINSSAQVAGLDFSVSGLTGAASVSRLAGATLPSNTSAAAPTSGTFAQGDVIVDKTNGTLWVCVAAGTPGTWVPVYGEGFQGPGQVTNITTGGANRTTLAPFHYTTSKSVVTTSGSGWSLTMSDVTFSGCGSFNVTPASNANSLGFLTIIGANCSISAGQLTLGGAAFTAAGAGLGSGLTINVNVSAMCW